MRAPIRKHLFTTFRREFEQRFPDFSLNITEPGSVGIWARDITPGLRNFVSLFPSPKEDKFSLEVAWSDDGEYPWECIEDFVGFNEPVWRERLGFLWKKSGIEPVFDLAPEDGIASRARSKARLSNKPVLYPPSPPVETVLQRVEPSVMQALEKFQKYGVPLFNKLANHRGLGDVL